MTIFNIFVHNLYLRPLELTSHTFGLRVTPIVDAFQGPGFHAFSTPETHGFAV